MIELKQLSKIDPLERRADKQSEQKEYSPMDPPDAYSPPAVDVVPYEEMPALIRGLMDEHKELTAALSSFEEAMDQLREAGPTREAQEGLSTFFRFIDDHVVTHHLKEEKVLFPLLQERLLESGEHGAGAYRKTAIDMMEDDHIRVIQLAAVTFNLLGLVARLPDPGSRTIVLDAALAQGKALVELSRLHIFREDTIVFPLAVQHINDSEFAELEKRLEVFAAY
jgi:hemerythrin-like domain-containing protein